MRTDLAGLQWVVGDSLGGGEKLLGARGRVSVTECWTAWVHWFGLLWRGGGNFGTPEMPGRRAGGGAVATEVNTASGKSPEGGLMMWQQ
jgi:hypothetical protein